MNKSIFKKYSCSYSKLMTTYEQRSWYANKESLGPSELSLVLTPYPKDENIQEYHCLL